MNNDEFLMMRCIELAKRGSGHVSPNPLVGCVIIKNDKIVSEGYHRRFGGAHAEINAIASAERKGLNLKGAALYVNLEPCYHHGKTPPCVYKIIRSGFAKVVIGLKDPNPLVSGKSIAMMRRNGIKVFTGVLESQCRQLNKFFVKYITTGLPYVTMKAAQTLDGKIAREDYSSKWISSIDSRKLVHEMRSEYDAVIVGSRTVEKDNPELTVRHIAGRNPYRIVVDGKLSLKTNHKIFTDKDSNKTIVLTSKITEARKAAKLSNNSVAIVECMAKNGLIDLRDAMKKLGKRGISSILVEGGAETYSHFLKLNLVDEIMLFVSPKVFGKGISAFNLNLDLSKYIRSVQKVGSDVLYQFQLREY